MENWNDNRATLWYNEDDDYDVGLIQYFIVVFSLHGQFAIIIGK